MAVPNASFVLGTRSQDELESRIRSLPAYEQQKVIALMHALGAKGAHQYEIREKIERQVDVLMRDRLVDAKAQYENAERTRRAQISAEYTVIGAGGSGGAGHPSSAASGIAQYVNNSISRSNEFPEGALRALLLT